MALYWISRHRHHTMGSVVARECSKGLAIMSEGGALGGVPATVLHAVHLRVLGHTIHRAGLWAWEGRFEPDSRPAQLRVGFWNKDGVRLRGCKEVEHSLEGLGDDVVGLDLPLKHPWLPLIQGNGKFLLQFAENLGHHVDPGHLLGKGLGSILLRGMGGVLL